MATDGFGVSGWGGVLSAGSGGGGGSGGPGPVVSNFSPPDGTPIQRGQFLDFDIAGPNAIVALTISVVYRETGSTELVYGPEGFAGGYAPTPGWIGSERGTITNGFHFTLRRRGGWPAAPSLVFSGGDAFGNPVTVA